MSVFLTRSAPDENWDAVQATGSFARSTRVSPLPDSGVDLFVAVDQNDASMSAGTEAWRAVLVAALVDARSVPTDDDIVVHVQGGGKSSALIAYQLKYRRQIDAAHVAADLVVRDEVHRYGTELEGFVNQIRLLKGWAVNDARRRSRGAGMPSAIGVPATDSGAVDIALLEKCVQQVAGTAPAGERPARPGRAGARKRMRQVRRLFEQAIAEFEELSRDAGRHLARFVFGEDTADLTSRAPLSRIITLFRTNLVGNLTRNAPPAAA